MWAVVPLKSPETAKSRLADALSGSQRRELFFSMARHVLQTLRASPGITQVAVVTSSDDVAHLAQEYGCRVMRQLADAGTAQAFAAAIDQLQPLHLNRLLMISGDLPLLSTTAVAKLLAAGNEGPHVVVVPDRRRIGTNALLCAPPDALTPCFGANSFAKHVALARDCRIAAATLELDELALDLDDAEDLEYLRHRLPPASYPRWALHTTTAFAAGAC